MALVHAQLTVAAPRLYAHAYTNGKPRACHGLRGGLLLLDEPRPRAVPGAISFPRFLHHQEKCRVCLVAESVQMVTVVVAYGRKLRRVVHREGPCSSLLARFIQLHSICVKNVCIIASVAPSGAQWAA